MSKTLKLLIALLVASGMLVACGGDDDDDGGASAEVDADAEADADADVDDIAAFGSEECQEASTAFLAAAGGASSLFGGQSDDLDDAIDELEAFADGAPEEIRADFKLVAEAYTEIAEVFADLDFDPSSSEPPDAETMAALEQLGEKFENSDFEEASENIQAWFEENCGVPGE